MKRLATVVVTAALFLSVAGENTKRLSAAEKDHYTALRVWMDKKERKAFLKLKTEEERDAWLKENGYWNRFYQYDRTERDEILAGNVRVGWTYDRVYMAWGPPHQKRRLARQGASRSEMLVYRAEVTDDDRVLIWEEGSSHAQDVVEKFRYEVIVDDGVVAEMNRVAGWDE